MLEIYRHYLQVDKQLVEYQARNNVLCLPQTCISSAQSGHLLKDGDSKKKTFVCQEVHPPFEHLVTTYTRHGHPHWITAWLPHCAANSLAQHSTTRVPLKHFKEFDSEKLKLISYCVVDHQRDLLCHMNGIASPTPQDKYPS